MLREKGKLSRRKSFIQSRLGGEKLPALALPACRKSPTPSTPEESPGTMNIFRILGDVSHLLAIIILLLKIVKSKSCAGECSHVPGKEGGPSRRAVQ